MGFIERAFTPPGTGAYVPPPAMPAPTAPTAMPAPPTLPVAPAAPPQFRPGQAPGGRQRAVISSAGTMLGAAAAGGQTAKKTLLGA